MKKLNGIILENADTGYFIAFIKEFPVVKAQARTRDEVQRKLEKAFNRFMDFSIRNMTYTEPEANAG